MDTGERAREEGATGRELGEEIERPWLSSVMIGEYPGLGGDVTIQLSPRCTVLVGRNGAGKSILLDALESLRVGPHSRSTPIVPGRFECTVARPGSAALRYEYQRFPRTSPGVSPPKREVPSFRLTERESIETSEGWRKAWSSEGGVVSFAGGLEMRIADSFLAVVMQTTEEGSSETRIVGSQLRTMVRIRSGVPREKAGREEIFHRLMEGMDGTFGADSDEPTRLHFLSSVVAELSLTSPWMGLFEQIRATAQRIGVASEIRVVRYSTTPQGQDGDAGGVCEVLVDGTNIGLLPDGTLRVLETLLHLATSQGIFLLEEPETGIHPALLTRLLRELEAYEGQVIISTHSPQVVSWAKPDQLRLVEREAGKTTVRALTPSETERVHEYLAHDGTLGEFVYGGALDADD